MEVRFHQLEDHIDVLELSWTWRQHYVFNLHNVCIWPKKVIALYCCN